MMVNIMLTVFLGIILGGFLEKIATANNINWLLSGQIYGLNEPVNIDTSLLKMSFKMTVSLNVSYVVGFVVSGLIIYFVHVLRNR